MANPSGYTQDRYLERYARMLAPKDENFIAFRQDANPTIDVTTRTGNFIDVAGGFASETPFDDMVLTDGMDRPNVIPTTITEVAGWTVQERAKGVKVNKRSQQYAEGNGNSLRQASTARLNKYVRIIRERELAALVFNATTFSGYTAAVGTGWDQASSDPSADAMIAQDSILKNTGELMNTCIVGYEVHAKLMTNPKIQELWSRSNSTAGIIPNDVIAQALGVKNYIVGAASSNTAADLLTESLSFIWGKSALFCKIEESPTPYTPQSCIQRFRFRGSADPEIRRYDLDGGYQEQIDMVYCDQFTVPTPALGYYFTAVVA